MPLSATATWSSYPLRRSLGVALLAAGLASACGGPAATTKVHLTSDGAGVTLATTRNYAITWKVTPPKGYTDCSIDIRLSPPSAEGASPTLLVSRGATVPGDPLSGSKTLQLISGDHSVTATVLGVATSPTQTVVDQCPWTVDINPG